jgi:hypothetical protein
MGPALADGADLASAVVDGLEPVAREEAREGAAFAAEKIAARAEKIAARQAVAVPASSRNSASPCSRLTTG